MLETKFNANIHLYNNLCLVFDDDQGSQVCTTPDINASDTTTMVDYRNSKFITFKRHPDVSYSKKIYLKFDRSDQPRQARITELKIYYTEELCIKIKAGLVLGFLTYR